MSPANVPDRWLNGSAYERYMGRWSAQVAPHFLAGLQAPTARRWLDVGCGTGVLSAAILRSCAPASVTGIDPSPGFLQEARRRLAGGASLQVGSATALPLADDAADVVVSGLVLNFVPDAAAALAEFVRVGAPGGLVAAYVWDYAQKMELIRRYWDAAAAIDPRATALHQGERFALCRPEALHVLFEAAGLEQVAVSAIEIEMHFADFDDYWLPFLGGQGPAPAHAMSLGEAERGRLREALRASLPMQPDGRIVLAARAWAVQGRVA